MYAHFPNGGAPYGYSNDGLLDIRLIYSHNLTVDNLTYAAADNARSPFVRRREEERRSLPCVRCTIVLYRCAAWSVCGVRCVMCGAVLHVLITTPNSNA